MALNATRLRELGVRLGNEQGLAMNKPGLIALVQAVDQWCDDNAASYNAALPQPFRANATATQKAAVLAIVAMARVS